MDAKAFISHTEIGGTTVSDHIRCMLKTSDHKMESFLSQHSIENGKRIPEKILNGLSESDILILIIDIGTKDSKWVKWEYDFCIKHGIPILIYVDKNYNSHISRITWLDTDIKYNTYDHENYDGIKSRVWRNIADKESELKCNLQSKKNTQLSITPISDKPYYESDKIQINGKTNKSECGKCYIHIPQMDNEECPIFTKDQKIVIQPIEQNFTFTIEIPILPMNKNEQRCFIEVFFKPKSIIIPITILKKDNHGGHEILPDIQPPNSFTAKTISTIFQPISDGTYNSNLQIVLQQKQLVQYSNLLVMEHIIAFQKI